MNFPQVEIAHDLETGESDTLAVARDWGLFRAGLYAFVSPSIALAVGVVMLGEDLHAWDAGAAGLMFTGTGLALRRATIHRPQVAA